MGNYERREITRVLDAGPGKDENKFRLKITGTKETRWLLITPEQLNNVIDAVCGEDTREPTWRNHLIMARKLPDAELHRHGGVSLFNHHRCEDCFCCACVAVLDERQQASDRS